MSDPNAIPVPTAPTPEEANRVNAAVEAYERSCDVEILARQLFVTKAMDMGAADFPDYANQCFRAAAAFMDVALHHRVPYPHFTDSAPKSDPK